MIFRIYLLIAILILLPICIFITIEFISKFTYYFVFLNSLYNSQLKSLSLYHIRILFKYYLNTKQWFKCIVMLEFYQLYLQYQMNDLFAFCYQTLSYDILACYYYKEYLNYDENIIVLQNLFRLYKKLNNIEMLKKIYDKIKMIDPENAIVLNTNL